MPSPPPNSPELADSTTAESLRRVPDPALLRLAHAVADLNPALAQSLCVAGLAAMDDAAERASWTTRLASFLDDGGGLPA